MGRISRDQIIGAVVNAIEVSQKDYYEWSSEWLWQAPEYLITVNVANSLGKLEGAKYVTLENSVKGALVEAGAVSKGRKHSSLRHSGRYDILFWWGNGTPRVPIEIKNQVTRFEKIEEDIARIKTTLKQKNGANQFEFGLMGFYSSSPKAKSLAEKLEDIETETIEYIGNSFQAKFHFRCFNIDDVEIALEKLSQHDGDAWAACCIEISLKA